MRPIPAATAALLLPFLAAACDGGPAEPQGSCGRAWAGVVQTMDSVVAARAVPGGILLVMQGDEVLCEHASGGYVVDEQVTLASASKWMTGVTLAALADRGELSLDDPVSRYVPEFTGAKAGITVRQLLSHTSGIQRGDPCIFTIETTLEACARRIAQAPLDYAPGTEFRYAGAPFTVAGRVAEVAAGQPWRTLWWQHVARPLRMEDVDWGPGDNPLLSGGARGTARDYAKMLRMMADGGTFAGSRFLTPAGLDALTADRIGGVPRTDTPRDAPHGYALGAWRDDVDALGQATQLSSAGASGFYPWVDLERNVVGIVVLPARDASDTYWYGVTLRIQAEVRRIVDRR